MGLAGLARLAVGRRSASRRRLLCLLTCGPALTVRCALGCAGGEGAGREEGSAARALGLSGASRGAGRVRERKELAWGEDLG